MDKRKLNYRFHNPNPPEAVGRELLQICIGANIKKVESAVRESVEKENVLRIVAVDKSAQVARLKEQTLFKMPKGQYGGKYYRISNDYIKECSGEIVLELPSDSEIKLLDEMQQECENLIIDEFVKAVAGKGEKEYEVKFRLPSAIYAEQIKNSPIIQTNTQFVK